MIKIQHIEKPKTTGNSNIELQSQRNINNFELGPNFIWKQKKFQAGSRKKYKKFSK